MLEKYADLYDFSPVGSFSLDEQGRILEVNLTGASLLGVERSRLVHRRLTQFVVPASRPVMTSFLKRIFAGTRKEVCEAALIREGATVFWASLQGTFALSSDGPGQWCRVAVSDIMPLKQAEEAQRRVEALAESNRELRREIVRRQSVERALKKSEQHSRRLLEQSRHMQEQLRRLSRQLLLAQEEERKKVSRELHDVIAQTLTSINLRLEILRQDAALNSKGLDRNIARTQRLVENSVDIVHRFARELRPTVLDDLGLLPALQSFLKSFRKQTGIRVSLSARADMERIMGDSRTVLYRVAQEALTNIARHADASQAEVKILESNDSVCMKIRDNGKGFAVESVLHTRKCKRLGLLGMRERLEMVGGSFSITASPGKGATILARIPLAADRARDRRTGSGKAEGATP
jgi:PAS domain S-box-containing protein